MYKSRMRIRNQGFNDAKKYYLGLHRITIDFLAMGSILGRTSRRKIESQIERCLRLGKDFEKLAVKIERKYNLDSQVRAEIMADYWTNHEELCELIAYDKRGKPRRQYVRKNERKTTNIHTS